MSTTTNYSSNKIIHIYTHIIVLKAQLLFYKSDECTKLLNLI